MSELETMNTETKITGREEAIAKLDEWKRQAETYAKERDDLVSALNKIRHEIKARFPDDFPLNKNLKDIYSIVDEALKGDK